MRCWKGNFISTTECSGNIVVSFGGETHRCNIFSDFKVWF